MEMRASATGRLGSRHGKGIAEHQEDKMIVLIALVQDLGPSGSGQGRDSSPNPLDARLLDTLVV